jgi:hypothetical protein
MTESSNISGVVVKSTIRFLNNKRHFLLGYENADGSVVFNSEFLFEELINERTEHRVIERLSEFFKLDIETRVDLVEFNARDSAKHFPSSTAVLVSSLELDNVFTSAKLEVFLRIVAFFRVLVEGLKICDVRHLLDEVREGIIEFSNEHTELSSPITNVVMAKDIQSLELENAAHAVTLDSGTQVTDMHVFSDIGRREINNDALFFSSFNFFVIHRHGTLNVGDLVDKVLNVGVLQLDV